MGSHGIEAFSRVHPYRQTGEAIAGKTRRRSTLGTHVRRLPLLTECCSVNRYTLRDEIDEVVVVGVAAGSAAKHALRRVRGGGPKI